MDNKQKKQESFISEIRQTIKKRIHAPLYMKSKTVYSRKTGHTIERDPDGYLFSYGRYRTKILPEDLPEWYVHGYLYKQHGYISAKGIKHLLYVPNYMVENHLHKYDTLFISYNKKIEPYKHEDGFSWYKDYDDVISGSFIVKFVEAVGRYSVYDVNEIQKELEKKSAWYYERNPE